MPSVLDDASASYLPWGLLWKDFWFCASPKVVRLVLRQGCDLKQSRSPCQETSPNILLLFLLREEKNRNESSLEKG